MRKLTLITVLMLASASAFAGETRSLTLASNEPLVETSVSKPSVDRAALGKVATKLAQAAAPANIQSDAAPTLPQTTTPATTTTTTTTTADTQPAAKPAKTATRTKRESDEHKARRIAAKYGVYW